MSHKMLTRVFCRQKYANCAEKCVLVQNNKISVCRLFSTKGEDGDDTSNTKPSIDNSNIYEARVPRRILQRQKQKTFDSTFNEIRKNKVKSTNMENVQVQKIKEVLDLDSMVTQKDKSDTMLEEFPSDLEEDEGVTERKIRPRIDPESTSIALFPGQGSQFIGMGKQLLHFPGVQQIYDRASEILGYDLLKLCLHGPVSELNKTVYCQPAVFVTSIAAIEKMKEENFQGIESTVAAAGFSVGEFAAMVFAEMMTFEDALKLVNIRAKEMQKASEETPSGMMTVFCFWGTKLKLAIQAAKEYCKLKHGIENPVCVVASYLFPEAKVIAGHEEALDFIAKNYKDFGIRKVKRIPVSGAFHTSLMESAKIPVRNALKKIEIQQPKIKVYSNVTSSSISLGKNFNKDVVNQIVRPVKWEQIMYKIFMRDKDAKHPYSYECGPGNQLGIFLQKINNRAYQSYRKIDV